MGYTKTTWVDNVTPVSAANLNKIETGIVNAELASNKQKGNTFVLGAAAPSFTITGLDINADGGFYEIQVSDLRASQTNTSLNMFINGDTAITNYAIAGMGGSAANMANIGRINATLTPVTSWNSQNFIQLSLGNSIAVATCINEAGYGTTFDSTNFSAPALTVWRKIATVTNITSITFSATTGTISYATVKIYKR